jgi:ParB family chromosome partitioning protein
VAAQHHTIEDHMGTQVSSAPRSSLFNQQPSDFTLVTKPGPFYDKRVHLSLDKGFVESIVEYGIIEPVIAVKQGDELIVVAGRQRVKGALEAIRLHPELDGKLLIPTIIKRGDDLRLEGMGIVENEGRRGDDPITRAEKMARFHEMCGDNKVVAKAFCCTTVTVANTLKLLDLSAPVKKAVADETISQAAALALYDLSSAEQKTTLDTMLAAGKTSATDAKRLKAANKASDDAASDDSSDDSGVANPGAAPKKAAKTDDAFATKPSMKLLRRIAEVLEAEPAGEDDFVSMLKWITGEIGDETAYRKLKWLRGAVKDATADRRRTDAPAPTASAKPSGRKLGT